MKINNDIKNMRADKLEKSIDNFLDLVPEKEKEKLRVRLERILLLKNNSNSKFLYDIINSSCFKLASLYIKKTTQNKDISPIEKWGLIIDNMEEIRNWCLKNNTTPDKWMEQNERKFK